MEAGRASPGSVSLKATRETDAMLKAATIAVEKIAVRISAGGQVNREQGAQTGNTSFTTNITFGGRNTPVNVSSGADAKALTSVLRQLESASQTAGRETCWGCLTSNLTPSRKEKSPLFFE